MPEEKKRGASFDFESPSPTRTESKRTPLHRGATTALDHATPKARTLHRAETVGFGDLFRHRDEKWHIESSEETMSDVSIVISLLADLTPAGILPLSNGMVSTGFVPAMFLLIIFGMAAGYMMYLIARTIEITGLKSFSRIWTKVIGAKSAWVPSFIVFCVCFGCCLAYACMFGDLFAGCMVGFGFPWATRTVCLIVLGVVPVWPLSCMRDLSVLAPTSFGALLAVLFTLTMMVLRSVDGTYAPGGAYHTGATPLGDHMFVFGPKSLALVNSLAVGYLCHYNGCKYYREYIHHRPHKFGKKIALSFSMVTVIFGVAMAFGFITHTFGADSVILNNYHSDDLLANIARLSMGLANALSFPLMFSGLREQAIELICFFDPSKAESTTYTKFQNILSTIFVGIVVFLAVLITDASVVVGLVGSLCGAATIYVVPCLLFDRCAVNFPELVSKSERHFVQVIGSVGIFLMFAGAVATVAF